MPTGRSPNQLFITSFRDPAGHVKFVDGRVLRFVGGAGIPDLQAFLCSSVASRYIPAGKVVSSRTIPSEEVQSALPARSPSERTGFPLTLEHQRIPFVSYPYEWPPEMLHAAAALTLELARELLSEGLGLKDATPYNVLFRGPQPVFVDVLSFERRRPDDPIWLAHAQFVRTFLLPLLVQAKLDFDFQPILMSRRDGLLPREVYRLATPLQRFTPLFLSLVSIPAWLASSHEVESKALYQQKHSRSPEMARFILHSLLARLHRQLQRVEPRPRQSTWSGYTVEREHTPEFAAKQAIVEDFLAAHQIRSLIDVGCNTGHFSALAAHTGARVVAIDGDPVVVGETWRRARRENLDVLPLVVNLANPSPGLGWNNREFPAFLDRASGAFDAVLMLGVIHHLIVGEGIPLAEIVRLVAKMSREWAIVEYIGPDDPMFHRVARGREELYSWFTRDAFEQAWNQSFDCVQAAPAGTRWIYSLRRR